MNFFQTHSELILSFAKFTSALLVAFATAPFIKRPGLRATFWAGVILILPSVVIATHGKGNLNIVPRPSFGERLEAVGPVAGGFKSSSTTTESIAPIDSGNSPVQEVASAYATVDLTTLAILGFLAGAAVSIFPMLSSLLEMRRMIRKPAGETVMEMWTKIRPLHTPPIPIYLTSSPSAPFTAGVLRTAVFLPDSSVSWSIRRLRSTLLHEAAHITRRDPLVRMLAILIRSLLWFHPLVWMAHRRLILAQEEACDEIALAAGIAPEDYAADLLETARNSQAASANFLQMARKSQLRSRIQAILSRKQKQPEQTTMKTISTVILGVAAATYSLSSIGFSETPRSEKQAAAPILEKANEQPNPFAPAEGDTIAKNPAVDKAVEKLRRIIIPEVNIADMALDDVLAMIEKSSAEFDKGEVNPDKKGVRISLFLPKDTPMPRIKALRLGDIPVSVYLKYVADATKTEWTISESGEIFFEPVPAGEQ